MDAQTNVRSKILGNVKLIFKIWFGLLINAQYVEIKLFNKMRNVMTGIIYLMMDAIIADFNVNMDVKYVIKEFV